MAQFELVMPKMGESINEATVIRWLKNEGDKVEADEAILEVATDKVDSEVPTPEGGIIAKLLFGEGDVVPVGQAVAIISTDGSAVVEPTPTVAAAPVEKPVEVIQETIVEAKVQASPVNNGGDRFYSPLVLNIARKEGISMSQLESLPGSGKEGRVTKKDILAYVKNGSAKQCTSLHNTCTCFDKCSCKTGGIIKCRGRGDCYGPHEKTHCGSHGECPSTFRRTFRRLLKPM